MDEGLRIRQALGRAALAALAATLIAGCAVSKAMHGEPGLDISAVKVGATRAQVEAVVGAPQREWTTREGVRYCMYRYDAGIETLGAGIGMSVFMDVATLGLWEVNDALSPDAPDMRAPRRYALMAVAYDAQGIAQGVFRDVDEFAALPDDGRARAQPNPE
jgi:hypothetical protein